MLNSVYNEPQTQYTESKDTDNINIFSISTSLNNRLDTIEKILKDIMQNYPELIIKYPEIFKE